MPQALFEAPAITHNIINDFQQQHGKVVKIVEEKIVNIINLNEYFISLNNHDHPKKTSQEYQANYTVNPIGVESSQDIPSVEINVKLIASVNGIKSVPLKLVRNALSCIKLLFESITRRVMPRVFN